MRGLSAQQALRLLEHEAVPADVDCATTLLQLAQPDKPAAELASLSVGERDAALLALRAATFGPLLECRADCPECGESLEFSLNVNHFLALGEPEKPAEGDFTCGEYTFRFRAPTAADLAVASECLDVPGARERLIESCVLQVRKEGKTIPVQDTPDDVLGTLSEEIAARARTAELLIRLSCPSCETTWSEALDIAAFFWEEARAAAERILAEVHALARAYGWREEDILAMTSARRQLYVERVMQ